MAIEEEDVVGGERRLRVGGLRCVMKLVQE